MEYIGHTRRKFKTRFNEHFSLTKYNIQDKSAGAKRCLNYKIIVFLFKTLNLSSQFHPINIECVGNICTNQSDNLIYNDPGPIRKKTPVCLKKLQNKSLVMVTML